MRIAMSSLACGDFGRPTRRARLNSAPVDAGMSEKSSRLSGVGLARADDANRFFGRDTLLYIR